MDKKKLTLKKISVQSLMETLAGIFNMGANFVDIQGVSDPNEDHDVMLMYVRPEYMHDAEPIEPAEEKIEEEEFTGTIDDLLNFS